MKRILFVLSMLISVAYGQSVGYLRYDTVRIEKIGGNAELILLNSTRNVTGGVLTNIGNGRTGFVTPTGGTDTTSLSNRINLKANQSALVDSVTNKLTRLYRKPGTDSVFSCIYNSCTFAYKDTLGGGGGTTYTYKEAIKENAGIVKINNRRDVVIFDQTFTAGSLPGTFTAVGSPSYTADGTGLHFTGTGSGTFGKYIRSNSGTMVESSEIKLYFTINATTGTDSFAAVGFNSYNSSFGHSIIFEWVADASNLHYGQLHAYGTTGSYHAYSDSAKTTYSVNDQFILSLERDGLNYYARVQNVTKGWSVVLKLEATTPVTPYIPHNSAYPAFYQRGGSFTVTRFSHTVYAPVVTDAIIVGDSKVLGQGGGNLTRWAANVGVPLNNIISGGGGDATAHIITRLNEIIALNPKRVLIDIGGNDILYAVPSATWQANLVTIYNTLTAAGIEVIFVYPSPRTSTDISAIPAYLDTANVLNLAKKIRTPWYSMLGTGYAIKPEYNADGTHDNDAGNQYKAYLVNVGLNFPAVLSIQNQNAGAQANASFYISGIGKSSTYFMGTDAGTGADQNKSGAFIALKNGSTTEYGHFGYYSDFAYINAILEGSAYKDVGLSTAGTAKAFVGSSTSRQGKFTVTDGGTGTAEVLSLRHGGAYSAVDQALQTYWYNGTTTKTGLLENYVGPGSQFGFKFYPYNGGMLSTPTLTIAGTARLGINKVVPISTVDVTGSVRISDSLVHTGITSVAFDTTANKPVIVGTDGVYHKSYWPVGTGGSGAVNDVSGTPTKGITVSPTTGSVVVSADTLLLSTRAWRQKGIDSVASLIGAATGINNQYGSAQSARFWIAGSGRSDSAFIGRTVDVPGNFKAGGWRVYPTGSGVTTYMEGGMEGTSYGWIKAVTEGSAYKPLVLNPAGSGIGVGIGNVTSPTAALHLPVATASFVPLRLANSGTTVTSFNDGDIWNTGHTLRFRANSATRRLLMSNDAAPSNGQIPIGNGTDYTVANITSTGGTITITNGSGTINIENATPRSIVPLQDFYTSVSNSGTTETDLYSFTIPANTLVTNGEKIIARFSGSFNDATGTETMKSYFAGTATSNIGGIAGNPANWDYQIMLTRSGTTTARVTVNFLSDGIFKPGITTSLTGLDFTTTNIFKITGTSSQSVTDAIKADIGTIYWQATIAP